MPATGSLANTPTGIFLKICPLPDAEVDVLPTIDLLSDAAGYTICGQLASIDKEEDVEAFFFLVKNHLP